MRRLPLLAALLFTACAPAGPGGASPLDGGPAGVGGAGASSGAAGHDASTVPPADAGAADSGTGTADAGSGAVDAGAPSPDTPLRTAGSVLVHADGRAVDFRGAISCCGGAFGWPLFDEAWVDRLRTYNMNFLHARLGPFLTTGNGETDWEITGGPYMEHGGRADLTQFNPAFWMRVRALLSYARTHGFYVEVDLADGWAVKHCQWGDIPGYSAWDAAFNVQGEDACAAAGTAAVAPGSVHDRWVRKVVQETGDFDNVIYQDGNEIGLVNGYSAEWTASLAARVRDEEAQRSFQRHLFGTNSGDAQAVALESVDFGELHQNRAADPTQCGGKPCLVNEYNPDPPMEPAVLHERYCAARNAGTYFWYWRHGQDATAMDATLALLRDGCP
ncbi:MAG: hypothetical protein HY904_17605 [Deltaproteobacteria bacterium]|nr:hypothetical protein [Deltaproteobacteria bacterium]